LGSVFEAGSPVVDQIYIYGNSNKGYLLAVVVPNQEAVVAALQGEVNHSAVKQLIKDELQSVARGQQLKSFEVPRDFIIEHEPFSAENGLLSSVRKRLRPQLKNKYSEQLEALYTNHERQEQESLEALKDSGSSLSTQEKLSQLLAIELKLEGNVKLLSRTFAELGGDSLSAVSLALSIEEIFEVSMSGDSILSPTGCVEKWAKEIDRRLNDDSARADCASIHGKACAEVHAKDLELNKFLGDSWQVQASNCQALSSTNHTVLLTGANGFLGREVCIQWLEKLARVDGKLICIIRAKNDHAARERLDSVFASATPSLNKLYRELAGKHLEVLAGDAAEEFLGLGGQQFAELAKTVDRICHVAALVNHRLAYGHLFGPNVGGTAEIIRLATSHRNKAIDFVSTEGVIPMLDSSTGSNEDALPLATLPLTESYASGYATSKWAGEVLLRQAHERFGVPVNILRGNMMLAHQHYRGQINSADMFTRLLFSIIVTGLAPRSFYPLAQNGERQAAHYDGLPVNVVAAAVVGSANHQHQECRAFNINNYHDDGMSLDTFADWIESAGYPVTRLDDYSQWYTRFKDKLTTLPENLKRYSALEILGAFETPNQLASDLSIDCDHFKALAGELLQEGLPHLNEKFIHKCLDDMKYLGMIDEVEASNN
jgi:fatty acid CoA ligase FadD9